MVCGHSPGKNRHILGANCGTRGAGGLGAVCEVDRVRLQKSYPSPIIATLFNESNWIDKMKSEEYLDLEKKLRHREQMERYSREKELDRQQQRMHMNKIEQLHEDQRRRERNNSPEQKNRTKLT